MRNEEGFFVLFAFKKSSAHHVSQANWFFGQPTHSLDNNFFISHSPITSFITASSSFHHLILVCQLYLYIGNVCLPLGANHIMMPIFLFFQSMKKLFLRINWNLNREWDKSSTIKVMIIRHAAEVAVAAVEENQHNY